MMLFIQYHDFVLSYSTVSSHELRNKLAYFPNQEINIIPIMGM